MIDGVKDQDLNHDYIQLTFDERLQVLIDYVFQEKYNRKMIRLIKSAKFRFPRADINTITYP